jgi:hypothetical protein
MMQTDGLNFLLAWVFFGILVAVLAWLLLRSGRDDALSPVVHSWRDDAPPPAREP